MRRNKTKPVTVQNWPQLLTPSTFAAIVKLHPESVRRSIRSGEIKARKFKSGWRIEQSEAQRILERGLPSEAA